MIAQHGSNVPEKTNDDCANEGRPNQAIIGSKLEDVVVGELRMRLNGRVAVPGKVPFPGFATGAKQWMLFNELESGGPKHAASSKTFIPDSE
jgi:hypothetical protein